VRPWVGLHRALMPEYNVRATTYWLVVVGLGMVTVGYALARVADLPAAELRHI